MNSVSGVSQLQFVSHRLRQPKPSDEPSSATLSILPHEDKDSANNDTSPISGINKRRKVYQGTAHFKLLLHFHNAGATRCCV